jgi:NitT/TauT family transport system substrate-binding protein
MSMKAAILAATIAAVPMMAEARDTVRVGYQKLPPLVGLIYGKDKGIFEKFGINLEIVIVNESSNLVTGLAAGSLDIVGLPAGGGIQARVAAIPITAIAISKLERFGKTDFQIVGNAEKGLKTAKDLAGRVVGIVEKDSPAELQFRDHIIRDGGDPSKVTFVALPFPQLPSALEVGNVDAIGTAQPFLGQILASKKIQPIVLGEGAIASLKEDKQAAIGAFFAMKPWLDKGNNKDVTTRFLKALLQSYRELAADRASVNAILMRDFGMPEAVAGRIPLELETDYIDARPADFAPIIRAYQRTGFKKINFTAEQVVTSFKLD